MRQEKDIQQAMSLGAKGYVNKTFFDFDNNQSIPLNQFMKILHRLLYF